MKNVIRFPAQLRAAHTTAPDGIRYRTIHGYRRAFVLAGQGPALLLIHGIGDSSESWRDLIPTLARNHTVIAPDLLGHGESDKPRADYSIGAYANAMRDLLSVLDIDRVTVVGHSLGGGVAMQFAYQFPERCERLVLISTGGVSHEVHPMLRFVAAPNADLVLPLLGAPGARPLGQLGFRILKALKTKIGHDADQLTRVFDALPNAASRRAFVRTLRAAIDWRGQAITMLDRCYLAKDMPTLLIWGERDGVIPVAHAYQVHAAMPESRLEVFANTGHFPHQNQPARFLELFGEFYDSTLPCSHSAEEWRALLRKGSIAAPVATPALRPVASHLSV
ncbi:MAG: alpha/beta fold hydrolase [Polyangiales bacterium]